MSLLSASAGIQNLLNAYQKDFDRGAQRDSNYIYGPARPRTFSIGIRLQP
ncbi:outer membrane receptor protein involved in Fe transport [Thermonema lapsum]|uniref:Outer membrane receptor protein involved in Fe transport n=1 Tax=Thermonema lapsum TaxID=28195 RepID=A0A846MP34_9BACT|nr:TonB-dependent receptor [Thermonema lapsum]NIK73229.1 outer membrane receptor protein involved in Fe transport [Thermonema lapsum]